MSAISEYARSNDGLVHLIDPCGGEHTFCGDAFDIDSVEGSEHLAWKNVRHGPVTCPNCARAILACRGVRIKLDSSVRSM